MAITAAEQYGIELLNRARLDPLAEVARYGLTLNQNTAGWGTITATAKQVLAPNDVLDLSATRHAQWMIDTDTFSHTGINNSDPGQRMTLAGYNFSGGWSWGENLALASLTGGLTTESVIAFHHKTLMESAGHRVNIMRDSYREIGYSQALGSYQGYNTSITTENFAHRSAVVYVTGVAYTDSNHDNFYSIGEGRANLRLAITGGAVTQTGVAGGYALEASKTSGVGVDVGSGATLSHVILNLTPGNVKLDLVNGTTLLTSGSMTLVSGVSDATLLGTANLILAGNAAANILRGNSGANQIFGKLGNDAVNGGAGNDLLRGDEGADALGGDAGADTIGGGAGADTLRGGLGNDILTGDADNDIIYGDAGNDIANGGLGNDVLNGGSGNDILNGSTGNDALIGSSGSDSFIFANGSGVDKVLDFSVATGDRLQLDDALWGGIARSDAQIISLYADVVAGKVVFNFGDADTLTLTTVTTLNGLAALIDVI